VHHHSNCHLHTYVPASTPNSVYYHCGRPSTPCTIIPTVICTHTFQCPPPTQYTTIVEDPQHRTPSFYLSFAHIFSSVHHQLSILPLWKTLSTGVSALQDERRLHHTSPRAIPTSVLVTRTIRPERTTKYSTRPNPQHRRLRSPRRPSATPHFAQRAIQLAFQTRHLQHISPNARCNKRLRHATYNTIRPGTTTTTVA
jgi:hypothetical protein